MENRGGAGGGGVGGELEVAGGLGKAVKELGVDLKEH